ncbi:hypothetical protein SNOUR_40650 [Streptomyces noursei ATCC 11455]|uniref:hypothetical protein n=1 Tax=Streptomyces noursei TaxID=1971 RepID=UPI00081CCE81|nr:hypothetical protein SNOUR_40650 [Streptomyces noursei ATCC 11455]
MSTSGALLAFARLAVVRNSGRSMQERKGSKEITAAGPDGKPVRQNIELVESVDVQEWQDIRFVIDGDEAGTARYEGQARQSDRKPPCWRVMHRVTFVSRLLPPVPPAGAPPLERTMRELDVESNYELIRRLDPYVKAAATGRDELAEAVCTALSAHLPELLPHAEEVTGFLAQYYGVEG